MVDFLVSVVLVFVFIDSPVLDFPFVPVFLEVRSTVVGTLFELLTLQGCGGADEGGRGEGDKFHFSFQIY